MIVQSKNVKTIMLYLAITSCIFLQYCKKSNEAETKTTLQKIQAKWKIASIKDTTIIEGIAPIYDEYYGSVEDYVDFRIDNKVYLLYNGEKDTLSYKVLGEDKIVFNNEDTAGIQTITASQLIFSVKLQIDPLPYPQNYYKFTTRLKK